MSKLKRLYTFQEEEIPYTLVYIDEFYQFIKERATSDDRGKLLRSNFLREFRGHKDGIQELSHGNAVSISSVLKFIFNHFDDYKVCHDIGVDISKSTFLCKSVEETRTLLGLYKAVAEFELKQTTSKIYFDLNFNESELCIQTLHADHMQKFAKNEWKKICMFENHFSKYVAVETDDFETELKRKWETFDYLKTLVNVNTNFTKQTKSTIKQRSERQKSFEKSQNVEIWAKQRHYPAVIEYHLVKKLDPTYPDIISTAVCVDSGSSIQSNSVMIVFSCHETDKFEEIAKSSSNILQTQHHVNISKVIFLHQEKMEVYKRNNNEIARFHLIDDIIQGKATEHILRVIQPESKTYEDSSESKCDSCFEADLPKPLTIKDFSLLQEWFLDVPLDIQILFETFINKESFYVSADRSAFLSSKLERLYGVYDILLNTYNRNYIGVLQQANTDELAMHFRSITTVFSIASNTGISTSLKFAENKIKQKAMDDLCYYNTFLKRIPLVYHTIDGESEHFVNLRDCHLILMLDNLVRLINYVDPNPGENRIGQLCTLPITVQGLPKNNIITDSWHREGCDRSDNCTCKQSITLSKDDFERVLISPTPEEEDSWNRFFMLMTWGNTLLWKKLKTTNLVHQSEEETTFSSTEEDCDLLDLSDMELECGSDTNQSEHEHTNIFPEEYDWNLGSGFQEPSEISSSNGSNIDEDYNEENLDSLLTTASLVFMSAEILTNEAEMSGICELSQSGVKEKLEESFSNLSLGTDGSEISEETTDIQTQDEVNSSTVSIFGFKRYEVPPLLCRHPPPAMGRDDDICKLREIMDDILVKTGRINKTHQGADRILFGPDNKIGINLLKLVENDKYKHFLPEFPLLHLRKSKINTLFSAYKDAGLVEILMFMCDNEKKEWAKMVSIEHIDTATKFVKRLALSFHTAMLCRFLQCIDDKESKDILKQLEQGQISTVSSRWQTQYLEFVKAGSSQNATFALHVEMMQHCDEVLAVYMSERLGGDDGYNLLLSAVKSSLLFSFLNGAVSYGPYCARLLIQHYSSGYFHKCMKKSLYTTPIGGSITNFAGDSKREMDHQDVLRGFRSGSTTAAVTSRMSLIDSLNETHNMRSADRNKSSGNLTQKEHQLEWKISEVDLNYIIPTASLILRRGGLSLEENDIPENVYALEKRFLSPALLDNITSEIGKYLVQKFLGNNQLLEMTPADIPDISLVTGPKSLLSRAKRSKGVTLKRTTEKTTVSAKTEKDLREERRKTFVRKEIQMVNLLSSEMNMCQSVVKPDCTKPKVMKSRGIQQAITALLSYIQCTSKDLIILDTRIIPDRISASVQMVTIEFAGVKFKAKVASGVQYIAYVQNAILKSTLRQLENTERIVLCEEKYLFTPDNFKAATHKQRESKKATISHLRDPSGLLNKETFKKDDIITTREGKSVISKYLAANAKDLRIDADVLVDIDSELILATEPCRHEKNCPCEPHAIPIRCHFTKSQAEPSIENLSTVHQSKGEAEMAQVDWLFESVSGLSPSRSACSLLTSGDIDAVPIHLFALASNWPKTGAKYANPVHVILQKPQKKIDIYNITGIMEAIEHYFKDEEDIVKKIAIIMCMGGNDFIPKFQNISHKKMLNLFISNEHFRSNLFHKDENSIYQLNVAVYKEFIKYLFCPKSLDPKLAFADIQKATMYCKTKKNTGDSAMSSLRNAKLWLPPESALERMACLVNLQIEYLETAGHSNAKLPDFLKWDCLKKTESGDIEYYFGPDARRSINEMKGASKRSMEETPQKGRRKKRIATSTPSKSNTNTQ